jgi:ATP/maltotriose-dependent transcriptional regulator MalT
MTMTTRAGTSFYDAIVAGDAAFQRALADGERALALARELDWRAGEAFALWTLGTLLGHYGQYPRALELTQRASRIAEAIGHTQWQASSQWTLGMLYLDLFAPRQARMALGQALALGRELGSAVWTHHAASALAVAYLGDHEHERAALLLQSVDTAELPLAWSGKVALLWARVSLALNRRDPDAALSLLAEAGLTATEPPAGRNTMRLLYARGEALAAAGYLGEAEQILVQLRDAALQQGARPALWRAHIALGALYHRLRQPDAAQGEYSAAATLIAALGEELPEGELRAGFLRAAAERIPSRYSPTSRRARARRFDGLTAREVEVATLVAQGRSNREIAEALVVGDRTVETHISNIFAKLHVASRHEVAAWARQKGLLA